MNVLLLLVLLLSFFLLGVFSFCNNNDCQFMSLDQTSAIKGFAIILTYFHHFGQIRCPIYNEHTFLGFLGVALFLFVSGYVTCTNTEAKGYQWHEKFWTKKFKRLYAPKLAVIWSFGFIAGRSFGDNLYESMNILSDWFFTAIIFNYIVFFIAKKVHWPVTKFCLISEFLFVIFCIVTHQQIMWYNTAFLFGLGVLFAEKKEEIYKWINGKTKLIFLLIGIVFLFSIFGSIMRYQRFVFDTTSGILFVVLFLGHTYKRHFYSRLLAFVGKYSWEFYPIHTRVIGIVLNRFTNNNFWAFLLSFLISMLIAMLIHNIVKLFFKLLDNFSTKKGKI